MNPTELVAGVPVRPRPILIVEDDAASTLMIRATLHLAGLVNPVLHSGDGGQAIDVLSALLQVNDARPALVLLDGQLPGRSGLQVLTWIRLQPALTGIPVIFLTGDDSRSSIRDAYAAGATSYLVKPVAFDVLTSLLRGLTVPWMLA